MKKTQKGFLLAESLIVISFIGIMLFYMFLQFNLIFANYEKNFKYNSIESLHAAHEVKQFLLKTDFSNLVYQLNNDNLYVEFSNCSFSNNQLFCEELLSELNINKIYFVDENLTSFINHVQNSTLFSNELINYLDYIKYDRDYEGYRLLIEFNDQQFCSINFL